MKLVLAEKPSVAQSLAKVLGANKRCDGYLEGNGYIVSWCIGHLVELSPPDPTMRPMPNGDLQTFLFCQPPGSIRSQLPLKSSLVS